jgi:hypothetical protein
MILLKSNLACIPVHAVPFLDVKNFDKAGMHLLDEKERMLEGAVLILALVNVALHFMKLFKTPELDVLLLQEGI